MLVKGTLLYGPTLGTQMFCNLVLHFLIRWGKLRFAKDLFIFAPKPCKTKCKHYQFLRGTNSALALLAPFGGATLMNQPHISFHPSLKLPNWLGNGQNAFSTALDCKTCKKLSNYVIEILNWKTVLVLHNTNVLLLNILHSNAFAFKNTCYNIELEWTYASARRRAGPAPCL